MFTQQQKSDSKAGFLAIQAPSVTSDQQNSDIKKSHSTHKTDIALYQELETVAVLSEN